MEELRDWLIVLELEVCVCKINCEECFRSMSDCKEDFLRGMCDAIGVLL